jgi:hypothetical protein
MFCWESTFIGNVIEYKLIGYHICVRGWHIRSIRMYGDSKSRGRQKKPPYVGAIFHRFAILNVILFCIER